MQEIELLVSTENGSIVTNIEVIKKHIAAGLEEYKHMVFTEETKKEAKATVADLRKLKKEREHDDAYYDDLEQALLRK